MTQQYRFKIVPKVTPNADGEWRTASVRVLIGARWPQVSAALSEYIPPTHFLVQYERVPHATK